jgi:2-succinyl-5-enolpyruvyl-6-hydroxy-3-cyclohexene-1-carboxylate synthase
MTNLEAARRLVEAVLGTGAREFCVCAGSRNAPLLAVLGAADGVRLYSFVDERSAAFFALGRVKLRGIPVAVVTTSGTAAAELLPAAIEAHYSGLPLILVTADRPARFRGTGAPQAIEQEGLFGPYAARSPATWEGRGPLHLNIEFDEPLIDGDVQALADVPASTPSRARLRTRSNRGSDRLDIRFSQPLVLLGGLAQVHQNAVRSFALRLNAPVYAEPLSGLREDEGLSDLLITSGERMISGGAFDGVVRIGNVPTLRFWRDLEESRRDLPVVHLTALPFSGLSRGEVFPIEALEPTPVERRERDAAFFDLDREMAGRWTRILDGEPQSELFMIRQLSRDLPNGARVYLGNSLPVREWDLVAARNGRNMTIEASRGANGIDGQLSTFLGQCDPARSNIAILGDLTALYDMNAPWIVPQLDRSTRFQIAIVNNGGGRIFSRVASLQRLDPAFRAEVIENAHELRFDRWAAMWDLAYGDRHAPRAVIELLPDAAASQRVWQRYDQMWSGS